MDLFGNTALCELDLGTEVELVKVEEEAGNYVPEGIEQAIWSNFASEPLHGAQVPSDIARETPVGVRRRESEVEEVIVEGVSSSQRQGCAGDMDYGDRYCR